MTAPELAYRHPKRGKAHRPHPNGHTYGNGVTDAACMRAAWGGWLGDHWLAFPVDSLDPADLCKRCWPERAK